MPAIETQVESAQRMYNARAPDYEDSWHPEYSKRFIELVPLGPGERVLDLCCGTGLEAFLAADIVGDAGEVVGVDISNGMLAVAIEKQKQDVKLGPRIRFLRHDVTSLGGLAEVEKESFDAIMCSNAFVLFEDPAKVVREWREYLKPGGILAVDITHELNMRSGLFMERVAQRLGVYFPSNRAWIKSKDSFRLILENEGYTTESIVELEKVSRQRSTYYTVDKADEQFDYVTNRLLTMPIMTDEFKNRARGAFKEEFSKAAVDGKVEVVDSLYVYIASKK